MPQEKPNAARRRARKPEFPSRSEVISSRDNRWLKLFRAALHDGYLPEENLIGLEGPHLVEEAFRSGLAVEALLVSESGEKHAGGRADARTLKTSDKIFANVAGTEHPQGIAALVRPREFAFDDLLRGDPPLVVVLAGVQDPGNVGTAVRSAEAFGATGVIATRGTADPWSAKAMRASAGSALRVPMARGIAPAVALAQLRMTGVKILAAAAKSPATKTSPPADLSELRGPCAVLIGNEGAGLPLEIERAADARLAIPLPGGVESLNAGVAASVILYEAARQRSGIS